VQLVANRNDSSAGSKASDVEASLVARSHTIVSMAGRSSWPSTAAFPL